MELQALIFDVDGTLAETERDGHRVAFNAAFAEVGLDWVWDAALYGELLEITGGKERLHHYIDRYRPDLGPHADAGVLVRRLHAAKTAHYLRLVADGGLPLRPGVAALIQEARGAGLRLAIATTTTPENVTTLLTSTLGPASIDWFEVIGAGDIVPRKKPAPDIYTWVLEQMRLPAAACLALEDSDNGLRAGLAAGLPTVVTVSEYTRGHSFAGAAAVLPDLAGTGLARLREIYSGLWSK